jgi:hypothetical protein
MAANPIERRQCVRSIKRLALWGVLAVGGFGCGGEDRAGAWEFKVDTLQTGAGPARLASFLRVVGQEGAEGKARTTPVILSFDCRPDQESITIMTDQALRQGTAEASLVLDGGAGQRVEGFAGTTATGGQVVLTIPQDSLLLLLSRHQRMVVSYADGAGSSKTTAEFPLAGLEQYRDSFLAACASRSG